MTLDDIYTVLIEEIAPRIDMVAYILAGVILLIGILAGMLLMKIFWDRWHV